MHSAFAKVIFLFVLVCLVPRLVLAEKINVQSSPIAVSNIERGQTQFGALQYLGGLVLESADPDFGGFSGILITGKGANMLAVSDQGRWFAAKLLHGEGRLMGIANPAMGQMLSRKGKPFHRKRHHDAESIAVYGNGPESGIMVGFERDTRIEFYKSGPLGLTGRAKTIKVPAGLERGPNNRELEAIGRFTAGPNAGKFVAISERNLDGNGNIIGYLWAKKRKKGKRITIARRNDYSVTDLAILRGGDIAILERRLGFFKIPGMAIRLIKAKDLNAEKPADGRVLIEASAPGHAFDNMEGLSAHRDPQGRLIFTLISDDNFNRGLQRTLLLQFAWDGQ
jgi:hypothetical protein